MVKAPFVVLVVPCIYLQFVHLADCYGAVISDERRDRKSKKRILLLFCFILFCIVLASLAENPDRMNPRSIYILHISSCESFAKQSPAEKE